ncbi:hypothetical protein [Parafilimonas terrae]|uniref:Uncharacterized protein n=1 Tax=Parafilimonas terrae TaxID=1465490 RepID=A0A1I5VRR2_9BACT|nr:hypothetical protein [Parafilimonas terrae]SFQ09987.1 hypothetical protein SAMN05444277_105141 [Parafilimonas terrae]
MVIEAKKKTAKAKNKSSKANFAKRSHFRVVQESPAVTKINKETITEAVRKALEKAS